MNHPPLPSTLSSTPRPQAPERTVMASPSGRRLLLLTAATLACLGTQGFAAWVQPTGLADGQQYRILFSTSQSWNNAAQNVDPSIVTYNGYVNTAAHSAGAIAYGLPQYTDGTTDGHIDGAAKVALNWAALGQTYNGNSVRANVGVSNINWNDSENGKTILVFNALGSPITSATVSLFDPSLSHLASGQFNELGTDNMVNSGYRVATGNSGSAATQTGNHGSLGNNGNYSDNTTKSINRTSPATITTSGWLGSTSRVNSDNGFYALSDVITAHVSGGVPNPVVTLTSADPIRVILGTSVPITGNVTNPSPLATTALTGATLSYGGGSAGGGTTDGFTPGGAFDVAIDASQAWTGTLHAGWNPNGQFGGGIAKSYSVRVSDGTHSGSISGIANCIDNRQISANQFAAHAHAGFTSPVTLPVTLTGSGMQDNVTTMPTVAATTYTTDDTFVSVTGVAGTFSGGSTTHTVNVTLNPGATSGTLNLALASGVGANIVLPEGLPGESINGLNYTNGTSNISVPSDHLDMNYTIYTGLGVWNVTSGGNWSDFSKWTADGGVPGIDGALSVNDTATFGDALLSGSATVNLDVSPGIKALTFNNTLGASYLLAGSNTLTLNGDVTVSNGQHEISAPLQCNTTVMITTTHSADRLTLSGAVAITGGLTKQGEGTLILGGSSTYTGTTKVDAGTLSCTTTASLASTALEIDAFATVNLGYAGNQNLPSLKIGGSTMSNGTYGKEGSALPVIGNAHFTGDGTVTVGSGTTPFQSWVSQEKFGLAPEDQGADKDPDGDGHNNLMEFALNGNPSNGADNGMVFSFAGVSGDYPGKVLILTIAVRAGTDGFTGSPAVAANATDGIKYTVMGGTNLNDWTGVIYCPTDPITTGDMPATPGEGYEYRSFILDSSNGLPGKGFMRAKVEPNP